MEPRCRSGSVEPSRSGAATIARATDVFPFLVKTVGDISHRDSSRLGASSLVSSLWCRRGLTLLITTEMHSFFN